MSANRSHSLSEMDSGGRLPDEPVEPTSADRRREAPESAQDLRHRLERLPHGHPSSPYGDDGTRKPPPPDLTKLELPLPDEPSPEPSKTDLRATDNEALTAGDPEDKGRINPDGSWEWKGFYLTADQNRAADDALQVLRKAEGRDDDGDYGDHGLTPAMRRIEAQLEHGRLVEDTEKYALKSPDRFKEKLAERISLLPGEPVEELAARIHDGIRYTFEYDDASYSDGLHETEAVMEQHGYELIERKPSWDSPDYKGINSQWRDPESGVFFEVQHHTHASWEAKQTTHWSYERLLDPRTSPGERARLEAYQRGVTASVPAPPGALEIPYYRKEGM